MAGQLTGKIKQSAEILQGLFGTDVAEEFEIEIR
jgi:hypothetical protein